MEEMLKEILGQIKNINNRLDSMENRLDSMEQKFERRFEAIDKRFEAMDKKFEARFEIFGGKLAEQYDLLAALEHRAEENSAYLTAITEDFVYVKKDGAHINKRLDHQLFRIAKVEEEIGLLKAAANS